MGRNPCRSKEELNKGAWTASEDEILANCVNAHGKGQWNSLANRSGLKRNGKSCRLRWLNYLRPGIKIGNISPDEEELIIRLHKLIGNRWSLIAGRIPGRTDNEIKNYWNTSLGKKVTATQSSPKSSKKGSVGKIRARKEEDIEPKTTIAPTSPLATATQPKPIETEAYNNHYINSTTLNSQGHQGHQIPLDLLCNSEMGTGIEDISWTCFDDDSNFFNFSADNLLASNDDANMNYNYNNSLYNEAADHSLQLEDLLLEDWSTTIRNYVEYNVTMDLESLAFYLLDD